MRALTPATVTLLRCVKPIGAPVLAAKDDAASAAGDVSGENGGDVLATKVLGLTIPPSVLAQATELIQ